MFRGARFMWCVILLLSVVVNAQRDSRWTWTANNRNSVDGQINRQTDRTKYETVEDFRDRYEANDQTTRKPSLNDNDYDSRFGFDGPNSITGNGYNGGSGFGGFIPQGLGAPNNFNIPPYGNQFNGAFNPNFGYQNNFRPGLNSNYYPNSGLVPNNGQFYPGNFGPNRNPYNPLGNSAANGVLVCPSGPTGLYGRPPNYVGTNQIPFNGAGVGGIGIGAAAGGIPFNYGFYNNFGSPFNDGFPPNGLTPFNSKSGTGILAESDDKDSGLDKKDQ